MDIELDKSRRAALARCCKNKAFFKDNLNSCTNCNTWYRAHYGNTGCGVFLHKNQLEIVGE